jgi:hypothetical protein
MGEIPEPVHDIADRDGGSGEQSAHGANKKNANAD